MRGTMSHVHRGIHEGHVVYLPTRSLPPASHVCFTWLRARVYSQLWISLDDRTNLCIRPRLPGLHLTVPGLIKETVYPMRYVCSLSRMNKIRSIMWKKTSRAKTRDCSTVRKWGNLSVNRSLQIFKYIFWESSFWKNFFFLCKCNDSWSSFPRYS